MNIEDKKAIMIISGEGDTGIAEKYTGKHTALAIKCRLTRERSNGDRWATAIQYSHESESGAVGIDLVSGEYRDYPAHLETI